VTTAHEQQNAESAGTSAIPLSRNRNYNILWTGQLFSELTIEIIAIAVPLLILAHSGSPLQMGLTVSVLAAANMVAVVPAGVVADRWDRRKVMLVCQGLRAGGLGSLVMALALDAYTYPHLLLVMVVEGLLGSVFDPAEHAALPQVVPESQLPAALARNAARPYVATLLGPAVAGFLFTLHPANPFVAGSVMITLSFLALFLLRLPRRARFAQEAAESAGDSASEGETGDGAQGGAMHDAAVGFRWVLGQRVIRSTLLWVMLVNLFFSALIVIILARSGEDQVGAGEMGLMMTCFGAGGLAGAALAARLHAALPASAIVTGFSWVAAGVTTAMVFVPSGLVLGVLLGLVAFLAPVANTTVLTHQMLATPDELRGRMSGVAGLCTGVAGVLGPLGGGLLMTAADGGAGAVAACAAGLALVAAGTTFNPALRRVGN